jgi:3-hydroxyisobutyrate dehydrogenase-like beta-hydroxyacid dehydrogenase
VGLIGKPMAENLLKKGLDLLVYDISREPLDALQKIGAEIARSPKEVGELADIVIIMVRDSKQAETVILGKDGVLEGAGKGTIIVVTSTLEHTFCQRVAGIAAEKGVGLIDAPVSGGARGAIAGTLTIMVGGDPGLFEKCRPVLEAVGKNIFYIGGIGMGQLVKIGNNMITNSSYFATTEAIAMVTKAGVDLERFLEVVRQSSGNTFAAQTPSWINWYHLKHDDIHNSLGITQKDLDLAVDMSRDLGLELAHLQSMAKLDVSELVRHVPDEVVEAFEPYKEAGKGGN